MGTLEMLKNLKGFSDTDHNHLQSSLCEADVLLDTTHFIYTTHGLYFTLPCCFYYMEKHSECV